MGMDPEGKSTSVLPSSVDTEDSLDEGPGALVLESDLLLGQDLEFEEEEEEEEGDGNSDQLLGFERDSEGGFWGLGSRIGDRWSPSPSGGGVGFDASEHISVSCHKLGLA